jgi:hypothetical protein
MYWQVDVKLEFTNDRGKVQKVTEKYLVEAFTATEAEAKIYKEFDGDSNFNVEKVVKSRILKVINLTWFETHQDDEQ